jgi:pilus assembly protein Flp/PilA
MYSRRELFLGRRSLQILDDEGGAGAIEYGLIAGMIAVIVTGTMTRLGKRQRRNYNCVKRAMRGKKASKFCKKRGA